MLNKLLYRLTAGLPCRLISVDGAPYLERYYLGQLLGVTFYLHRFVSTGHEQGLHNHPWKRGGSVVLAGSYVECRAVDLCPEANESGCLTTERRVRWTNRVDGNTFHQIMSTEPGTWTLFFHGARQFIERGMARIPKGWGFLNRSPEGTTVYTPADFPPTKAWWLNAPKGHEAGRVSL